MSSRFILPFADVGSGIKPSSGAKLFFFEVDGVTPKDTFSDQLSTPTPNTNPVISNSNGVFGDIYIEGVYKVTLTDKNDTQIFGGARVDSSFSAGAGGTSLPTTDLISSTTSFDADTVLLTSGFTTSGDGGGATWVQNGITGQTASQAPAQLANTLFNDGNGVQWALVQDGVINLESLGFTGSGDETLTIQAAINGSNDGSTITCNKKYNFDSSGSSVNDKTLTFDFKNSDVTMLSATSLIDCTGSYREQQSVVSISAAAKAVVVVADGSVYAEGDAIKLTCTDEQPDLWVAGRYIGQFAVVDNISGNSLTLDRLIYDSALYLTDLTIAILNNHTVTIKNIGPIGPALDQHQAVIICKDLINPTISNVNAINIVDPCFSMRSCFKYLIINSGLINGKSDSGNNNFGYGVSDKSSADGVVISLKVSGCRHAYTSNSFDSGGSLNMSCGYTTNARVYDSVAHNAEAGAWDTHPGAIDVNFINCSAIDSSQFGQSRSRLTRFINPYGRGLEKGIQFSTGKAGSTINPIKQNSIVNPDLEYTETFIQVYQEGSTSIALTDVTDITVTGGNVKSLDRDYRGLLLESRTVPVQLRMKSLILDCKDGLNTDIIILLSDVALNDVQVSDIEVYSETTSGGGNTSLVKALDTITGLTHEVTVQNSTFKGHGFEEKDCFMVTNANALVSDCRVEFITTGSLVAVGSGTSLTWGGEV